MIRAHVGAPSAPYHLPGSVGLTEGHWLETALGPQTGATLCIYASWPFSCPAHLLLSFLLSFNKYVCFFNTKCLKVTLPGGKRHVPKTA